MQRQGGNIRNPGGKPFGFIGATDVRKPTTCLDLRTYHDLPQCPTTERAHAISMRALEKLAGRVASLDGPRLVMSKKNTDLKAPLWPD